MHTGSRLSSRLNGIANIPLKSNSTATKVSTELTRCFPCTAGVRTVAPFSAQRGPCRYEPSITESSKFRMGVPGRSKAGHVAVSPNPVAFIEISMLVVSSILSHTHTAKKMLWKSCPLQRGSRSRTCGLGDWSFSMGNSGLLGCCLTLGCMLKHGTFPFSAIIRTTKKYSSQRVRFREKDERIVNRI